MSRVDPGRRLSGTPAKIGRTPSYVRAHGHFRGRRGAASSSRGRPGTKGGRDSDIAKECAGRCPRPGRDRARPGGDGVPAGPQNRRPLPGQTPAQQARFNAGVTEFVNIEGPTDGLVPVFIREWNQVAHRFNWGSKSVAKIMAKCQLSEVLSEKKQTVAA